MTDTKTVAVLAQSRSRSACRGCHAPIVWAEVLASGKRMPFDELVILGEQSDARGRVLIVDLTRNHWATCPQRDRFKSR